MIDHFHPFVPDFLDFAIFSEIKKSHYLMIAEIKAFLLFSSDTVAHEGKIRTDVRRMEGREVRRRVGSAQGNR